jgi:hypothetical protein
MMLILPVYLWTNETHTHTHARTCPHRCSRKRRRSAARCSCWMPWTPPPPPPPPPWASRGAAPRPPAAPAQAAGRRAAPPPCRRGSLRTLARGLRMKGWLTWRRPSVSGSGRAGGSAHFGSRVHRHAGQPAAQMPSMACPRCALAACPTSGAPVPALASMTPPAQPQPPSLLSPRVLPPI